MINHTFNFHPNVEVESISLYGVVTDRGRAKNAFLCMASLFMFLTYSLRIQPGMRVVEVLLYPLNLKMAAPAQHDA